MVLLPQAEEPATEARRDNTTPSVREAVSQPDSLKRPVDPANDR